jgi:hypothetical protein
MFHKLYPSSVVNYTPRVMLQIVMMTVTIVNMFILQDTGDDKNTINMHTETIRHKTDS